jgi:hypothetical protein
LPNAGSYARDFAVAPDESEIAFLRRGTLAGEPAPDAAAPTAGGALYIVPTNGGQASAFGAGEYALTGPRYVASASQLAWNGLLASADSSTGSDLDGGTPALKLGPRGGTEIRTLAVSDVDGGVYVLGGGNGGSAESGCVFAGKPASSAGAVSTLVTALLISIGRRRRKR